MDVYRRMSKIILDVLGNSYVVEPPLKGGLYDITYKAEFLMNVNGVHDLNSHWRQYIAGSIREIINQKIAKALHEN